jgi:penicillin-binding protein 2
MTWAGSESLDKRLVEHPMKRRFGILVLALLALVGCVGNGAGQGSSAGEVETPPPVTPDGVAQAFLLAWEAGDYAGMYSHLSPNSQAEYPLDTFTAIYTNAASTMTLVTLDTEPLSLLEQGTSAQVHFHVDYQTVAVGEISRDMDMLLVYGGGRWGIAWSPALILEELANGNTLSLEGETPARANIYDRNGQWMVSADATVLTISVVPAELPDDEETIQDMLELLGRVLRRTPEQVRQNYEGLPEDWYIALGDADNEIVQENWTQLSRYSGLYYQEKSGRRYYNVLAPHVLGYTGFIPEDDLAYWQDEGYRGDEIVGLMGLERSEETVLAGRRGGRLMVWTPSGEFFSEIASLDPIPSQSVYTTLDRDLQTIVQNAIEEAYTYSQPTWAPTSPGAAVVVMDVHTGEVLAMASYPLFDPNVMTPFNNHPDFQGYSERMAADPRSPFLNRATQGQYPPGSVFKIISMSAALGEGLYQPDTTYTCTGEWNELGEPLPCWLPEGHGTITLADALAYSCDTYFYGVGLRTGMEDFDMIPRYAREFMLGQETGIQIAEEPGLIPDPDWLYQQRGTNWTLFDSVNTAIGQGDVLVTPLQIAMMMSAVANGGTIYRPQLVNHIGLIGEEPSWTFEPEVLGQLPVSEENLAVIQESLRRVATDPSGTAEWRLGSMQIAAAGKTGTAQAPGEMAYPHAWFAGYFPADDPEIAVVVLIENGGQGSGVAAPIFRRIIEEYYGLRVLPYPEDWADPDLFEFVQPDQRTE